MGFFSGLANEGYDRQYSDRQLLRRILAYFRPHVRRMVSISAMLLLTSLIGAATPIVVSSAVDQLQVDPSSYLMDVVILIVLASGVLAWFANWARRRLTALTIGDIILTLRSDAFRASAQHDLSFYDEFSSGKVVSRITSDTQEFGNVVVLVADLSSQFLMALILASLLVWKDVRLALYLFAFMPALFLATIGFRRLARTVTRKGMRAMANVNAAIKETVSGIAIAKNFRQEASIYSEFEASNQTSYKVNVQRGLILSLVFPSLDALAGVGTAMLVYLGGWSTVEGAVTAGAWYFFLTSLGRFYFPVQNLAAFWTNLQSGLSAAERVFALMDAETGVRQAAENPVPRLRGEISFEQVDFRYSSQESVLEGFSLKVRPGENLALVGHTGAGKSSIAKLIARFYEFQSGQIRVDGMDIRTFDLNAYRRQLGIVSQVPFLFSGTVLENICYACPEGADRDEVEALARQIGNGEWLETLPQGLDTQTGERGARLSMGQRQLVSLMRVLVQRPAIFVLDEATASIDPFTEEQIQQALDLILANTTSILIAHRLSTVKAADRIIVLEKGRIIEEGTHDALLERGGHYAMLYNTFFRHQSLEYAEASRPVEEDIRE